MEILVLGSGAREHALCWRLARDEAVARVRIAPGNGGTPAVAETVPGLDPTDPIEVARHAGRERYDLVVVGPEAPLAAGVADALGQAGIPVFGPTRAAARLESSKIYAKEQMGRAGVWTAEGRAFADPEPALAYLRAAQVAGRRLVIKADWLAAGKGVIVPETLEEAEAGVSSLMDGAPDGSQLVLEERLSGREVSVFALVSGEQVIPLGAACDYKRLGDGDAGPNTGGMGAYTPVPWFGPDAIGEVAGDVFEPIAWIMARDGHPYRGVLYAGLMLTDGGPVVLEFNARFGDPEAQVLLPMLDGDMAGALLGAAIGDRGAMEGVVGLRAGAAVGVVVASESYPDSPVVGLPLGGADPSVPADDGELLCFHAGTRRAGSGLESTGGRVVTFVGRGPDLAGARDAAYRGAAGCTLEGAQFRTDIALRELDAAAG
ncbi:MAG: phosphoribosylamine--glycine ligase [Chloroflexota bacterium]|nr:phosphoribosylamine--glycine ligase [Chloroflexota bacterium]